MRRGALAFVLCLAIGAGVGACAGEPFPATSACPEEPREAGRLPDLEALLPTELSAQPATTIDSGWNCLSTTLGTYATHGVMRLEFAGATWDAGNGDGAVAAVFRTAATDPRLETPWVEEFYEQGARASRGVENVETSRPQLDGAGDAWRLDALNNLSLQTIIVWPHADHVHVSSSPRPSSRGRPGTRTRPGSWRPCSRRPPSRSISRPRRRSRRPRRHHPPRWARRPVRDRRRRSPARRESRATVAAMTDRSAWEARRDALEGRAPGSRARTGAGARIELPDARRDRARAGLRTVARPASRSGSACPGEPPFTRGIHPSGYRSRLWTMRMFAGFGAAEDTNARFKDAARRRPDRPVDRLRHADAVRLRHRRPGGRGRVRDVRRRRQQPGRHGGPARRPAARPRLDVDDDQLAGRADLGDVHRRGREGGRIRGRRSRARLQNDILKEFVAQKEFLFPPEPSMRLVTDTIEFGTREMPRWNTISICGYHIREAGSTAVQELAFTIADGMAYVEEAMERGLRVDDFAPRLSLLLQLATATSSRRSPSSGPSRRIWYKLMTERYRAENERSTWMRFHTQTAGVSLTPQQPLNNLTRVAHPGARRRPRRDAVAPHRRVRRGARRADRRGGAPRPAPAADHRRGDRRDANTSTRSAGRGSSRR